MKRSVIFMGVVILALTVIALFQVKHKVQNLNRDLAEINRQLLTNREEIHVLKAEWAYLNEPARIKKLADRYLDMKYASYAQLKDDNAMRQVYLASGQDYKAVTVSPALRPILSSYSTR